MRMSHFYELVNVPGLEKHGLHAMILLWSYHDHG